MVTQQIVQVILVLWLTKALLLLAQAASLAKPGCPESCGNLTIPYPFGVGHDCFLDLGFSIICDSSTTTPPKAYINGSDSQILQISLSESTFRIYSPVTSMNCSSSKQATYTDLEISIKGATFFFSDTKTKFTALGCDALALIKSLEGSTLGGCVSTCNNTRKDDTSACYGVNCCQTAIPPSLNYFTADLRSIDPNDNMATCKYAFLVDQDWFSNLTDAYVVSEMESVPAVLDWVVPGTCSTNSSTAVCGAHASCYGSNQTLTHTCRCDLGYDGNPYLSEGCQDIDECKDPTRDVCYGKECMNVPGGFICYVAAYETTDGSRTRVILLGAGTGLGMLLLLVGTWRLNKVLKKRRKNKLNEYFFKRNGGLLLQQQLSSGEINVEKTKLFSSKELGKATDHYNENRILGQGGQGTVYKGMLVDGRIVAVKKSKIVGERKVKQFINEVIILSQINHRNVVKLIGCCLDTEVPMLVYEFIPNGTLFQLIHDKNEEFPFPFSWKMRLRIATEIAGAISYLHSAASLLIYHRDIKSSNILLNDKYQAKVSDFGTSRSIMVDQTHLTTKVQGTFGYLDPEFFQSSQFTEKSDVYSFGVVLAELLTGEKPVSQTESQEWRNLAAYFLYSMEENRLFEILDAQILEEAASTTRDEEIMAVANLAWRCLNLKGKRRPTMKEVAMELEGIKSPQGGLNAVHQNHEEEVGYFANELSAPWDATLTSSDSSSMELQSLLLSST